MDTRMLLRDRLRRSRDWVTAIDELEKELEQSGSKSEQSERLYELARLTEDVVPERERALGLYQRAWKLHPDNLKALSRAREVYGEMGRQEMVAKLGGMELKSPAASAELPAIVGEALLDSGRKPEALALLERALEKTPSARVKDALAALNYAPEYWQDEVERLTDESTRTDASTATRMLLRAARIMRLEAPDDAQYEQLLLKLFEHDLDEPSANGMYEALLAAAQRWDAIAAHHERRILGSSSIDEQVERSRGYALVWIQRFKDRERAAAFFTRALGAAATNGAAIMRSIPAAFTLLRQVMGARGEWKELVERVDAIADHLVDDQDRLFVMMLAGTVAWRELGDVERARGYFQIAHEIAPDAPDVVDFDAAEGLADEAASVVRAPSLAELTGEVAAADVPAAPAAMPAPGSEPEIEVVASPAAIEEPEVNEQSEATPVSAAEPMAPMPVVVTPPPAAVAPPVVAPPVVAPPVVVTPPPPAAVAPPVVAPPVVEEVSADLDAAMVAARAAESGADKGGAAWREVVQKHPGKLTPRRELARVLRAAASWQPLVDALKDEDAKAAHAASEKAQVQRELAFAYGKLGNENQAMASWSASLGHEPNAEAYEQLAAIYDGKKRWPDLVKLLGERADKLAVGGDKAALYLQIANLYLERFSNQAEAIKAFEKVLEIDPDNHQAVEHLLSVYEKRRDWEKLIKLKESEIARAPDGRKAELTIEVARLAATKVKKPELCTYWWEKVIAVEPNHEEALAELSKLYERNKDWAKLADIASRQADVAADDKTRIDALQRLGLLYTEKVEDSTKAIDAWQRLLAVDDNNRRAQDALKKLYIQDARWPALEDFYRSRGKTDEYVRVLEREVEAGPEQHRLTLASKIAELYRDELAKPDRAMRAFEKVLALDPANLAAAEALIPLYESGRDPKKLASVLEIQLGATSEPSVRQERIKRLAEFHEDKLRDKGAAFGWWLKAHAEDHQAAWIRPELERLAKETGAWPELVAAYQTALPKFKTRHDALPLMSVMAAALERELAQHDRALELNRQIVDIEPSNQDALDALERLYLGKGQFQALLDIYEKKLELSSNVDERIDIQAKIGQLYEDEVKDDQKAVAAYQGILDAVGDEPRALRSLDRIYLRNQQWRELADILSRQITIVGPDDDLAAHLEFKFRLAQLREQHLAAVAGAIDVYRDILDLDPAHVGARNRLEARLDDSAHKLTAAAILEPIYEQLGAWRQLVGVHEIQVAAAAGDELRRVSLLLRIGELEKAKLGDHERGFAAYARCFEEDPGVETARKELEELADRLPDGWSRLTRLFEAALGKAELEPSLAHELATKVARASEERLGQTDKAVVFFRRALAIVPDDLDALAALETIFARDEKYADLLEVYRRRAEITDDAAQRLPILFRIASIHEEMLGQPAEAIRAYAEILEQDADNLAALRALDRLYVGGQHWQDLGDNLGRQLVLATTDRERVDLLVRLADLRETHLREPTQAIDTYRQVLELDPDSRPATNALERLIRSPEHEQTIAGILEPIYQANGDWKQQIGVYEIMARHAYDPVRKNELLHQIAGLHELGGGDLGQSFDTYSRALRDDPRSEVTQQQLERLARQQDRWKDLVGLYDHVASSSPDEDLKIALLFKQAQLHESQLGDDPAAVATYERVLAVAPGSVEAATAIQSIHERNGDWPALVKALKKKSEILLDLAERKKLLYRAAQLEEEVLGDSDAAVATFRQVLAIDDTDLTAMDALERLYVRLERWEPLKDVYAKKADLAEAPADKKRMLYVLGQVYDRELKDVGKAIETYQAVLDLDPDELPAIQSLDRLLGQAERWYDLLGNLERQTDLAVERQAELGESSSELVALKHRIGQLWQLRLGDQTRAIDSYREALAMEPTHAETLAALDELVHRKDGEPVLAARVLEPIYETSGDFARLVDVSEVIVGHTEDPLARVDMLHRIAAIQEQRLGDPRAAFAALARALKDDSGNEITLGHLERFAEMTGQWPELAALYAGESEKSLDVPRQVDLLSRLARVYEGELGDVERSIGTYRRIVDVESDNKPAVLALDRLYTATQQWKELALVLRREIRLADADEEIALLQFRLGQTLEDPLDDKRGAIDVYREILTTNPSHAPTLEALEQLFLEGHQQTEIAQILEPLYETAGEFDKLHRIYEVQLGNLTVLADRQSMQLRLAELAEVRLLDPQRAFGWWGQAAVEDPRNERAIDESERLARETASWDQLVTVYTQALARHDDRQVQRQTLLRLARVHEHEQRDAHSAVETHLRVLAIDAREPEALAALDRLYLGAGMYDELVEVLRRRIEVTTDPDEQIELHFRRGAIYSDALGDLDAALGCYQAVLEQESRNRRALEAQEAIYFRREDWAPLYQTYEKLIDVADGDAELGDTYARMARLSSEALADDARAVDLWTRVLDIRGEDPLALSALAEVQVRGGQWEELVELIERQVAVARTDQDQIVLYKRLGRVWSDKLGRERSALDAWMCADHLDPQDLETLQALAGLYRSTQSWDELSQTIRRIITVGSAQGKLDEDQVIELYAELGRLEGDVLGRVDASVAAWRSVLAIDAGDFRALTALEALFTREARWEEAIDVLEKRALVLDDPEAKTETLLQAASTWEEKVEDLDAAAAIYERVRAADNTNAVASDRLEAIYRAQAKWTELNDILLERAGQKTDVTEQVTLLGQVAKIYETELGDQDSAYVVLEDAFKRDFGHEGTARELERLATATNRWEELLGEYTNQVRDLETSNRSQAADLWVKIGRWYGQHLAHIDYALHSVQQALRIDPTHVGALAAMADLQRKRGTFGELAETLSRQAAAEPSPQRRAAVNLALGELLETQMMDQGQAISAYQAALANDPTSIPVLTALDRLYRFHQMWEPLIDVLGKRAALEPDERDVIRLKLEIGNTWAQRLGDGPRAIAAFQGVLEIDSGNLPALRALEQLYERTEQPEKYLEVLEAQRDASTTDAERVSLYERMAQAWEERFHKLDRAAECREKIVAIDGRNYGAYRELARIYYQAGRWENLVETYRNHILNTTDVSTRVDLYCAMGAVYENQLADLDRSIEAYTDVLGFDADEPRALDALGRLYEKISEWDRAIDAMGRLVHITEDRKKQVDLYSRIGRIQYAQQGDAAEAEANFLRGLAIDAGHVPSMEALTRLYSDRGDWQKAAHMMVRAESYTPVVLDKVRLLHDAAKIYQDRLRDPDHAKQLYAAVIALDPEHVEAGRPLAELYFENREWQPLQPVIEMLVRKAAQSKPDPRALNELYYRAARTADELGDNARAHRHYEAAYNLDSTFLPTLTGRADLLYKMGDWDGAGKIYQTILVQHRDSQPEAEVVRIYYRLGMVRQQLGERKKALNMFEKALEIDPTHRPTLEAVVDLQGQQGDWEAVVQGKRGLMATADAKDKVGLLDQIGTIYQQQLKNPPKAIAAYVEALEHSKDDHSLLQKLLDLYTEAKQWRKAVETIERFAALEADQIRRGSYLLAAGTVSRDELKAPDEAVDYYSRSLDAFFAEPHKLSKTSLPRALKAFQDIDKLLTAKKDWKAQERAYRAMVKRLPGDEPGPDSMFLNLRVGLLHALGEIYRSRLGHFQSAIGAFEMAQGLDAGNKERSEILAELYVRAGAEYADKAVDLHMKMLRDEPFKYDSYKALYGIYKDAHQYDKTWCMCATLAFLKKADPEQLQFFEQYKPRGHVKAKSVIAPDSWAKLIHPDENRYISNIFSAVWSGVAAFKAYPHKDLGIKRKDRRQLATDQLMFSKLFYYVAQVLGVTVPEVFLSEDGKPGDIQLANFIDKTELCPAFVVRQNLLQGRTEREVAYLSARRLVFMRPEYYLKLLLQTNTELKVALLSAIALVRRDFPIAPDVAPLVAQYMPEIQKRLGPAVFEQLGLVVNRFIQAAPQVDLARWGHAVDAMSYRAGFVVCGDLEVAARMVSAEPVTVGGPQAKDKIKDLVLYSISEEYFAVRQQMGLVIG